MVCKALHSSRMRGLLYALLGSSPASPLPGAAPLEPYGLRHLTTAGVCGDSTRAGEVLWFAFQGFRD